MESQAKTAGQTMPAQFTSQPENAVSAGTNTSADQLPLIEKTKPGEELLWKQYNLQVDLYKHYLDLVLKFNGFYYAATGAILSFYFSKNGVGVIRYSLLFPIILSIGFGVLFIYSTLLLRVSRQDLFDIRDKLEFDTAPDVSVLGALLILSSILMFLVAGILFVLFYKQPLLT